MSAPYAKRRIDVIFKKGAGPFTGGSGNVLRLERLRATVVMENGGLPNPPAAVIHVFGMTLDEMNDMLTTSHNWELGQNAVAVVAGDDTSMVTIFNGWIYHAGPRFNSGPTTYFEVLGQAGMGIQMDPVDPVSMQGGADVDTVLSRVLRPTGLKLDNRGVSGTLVSPYLPGTAMEQIQSVLRALGAQGAIDSGAGVLRIWPQGMASPSGEPPLVAPETGMIGYPEFDFNTLTVRTVFDPSFKSGPVDVTPGKLIRVKSHFSGATGRWTIRSIDYNLTSEVPGGPWEMRINAYRDPETAGNPPAAPAS